LRSFEERINSIFEACSFQDLTWQRIRRAITNLQNVETMLGGMIDPKVAAAPIPRFEEHMPQTSGPDLAQQEIDRLMNEF
jgi:chemotaxis protein CheZ